MLQAVNPAVSPTVGRLIRLLSLLWLAGVAMRMTLLVVPPMIPLVHQDLQMSETQIGLLIGRAAGDVRHRRRARLAA